MEPNLVKNISSLVYKRFPEMTGKRPKVSKQVNHKKTPKSISASEVYLLIFRSKAQGPNGRSIPRLVRVVANSRGKILKISTSRG
jgi:hypothetical protein